MTSTETSPHASPIDRRTTLSKVAYHEASHAVICVVLDVPFYEVTIIPQGHTVGGLALTPNNQPIGMGGWSTERKKKYAWCRGVIDLAGRIGETIISGMWDTAGAQGDLDDLHACVR